MGNIWCDLRALLFQKGQPRRSHQILFGENSAEWMGKIWCDLRALFFLKTAAQITSASGTDFERNGLAKLDVLCTFFFFFFFCAKRSRRSHQILSCEFGQDGWAKSGVTCALCLFRTASRADHTRFCSVKFGRMDGQNLACSARLFCTEGTTSQITPDYVR